jgi:hypothetical protein
MSRPTTPAPQPPNAAVNAAAGARLIGELEELLGQLTAEHLKLFGQVDAHATAMRQLDLRAMDKTRRQQEACRSRVNTLEHRRRAVVRQLARLHGLAGEPKVPVLADLYPARRAALMAARQSLREAIGEVGSRNRVATGLARSVLGHLNAAVRAFARAVDRPGTYTRDGLPRLADRIGVMEAVG